MKISLSIELDAKSYQRLVSDIAKQITARPVTGTKHPVELAVELSDEAIEKTMRRVAFTELRRHVSGARPIIRARGRQKDSRTA
jgi:hypothetical protein